MTYDAIERSDEGRRPIELYVFRRSFDSYRFTSASDDVVVDGATYLSRAISRGDIEASNELARSDLKITAPRDFEVADLFRISPPGAAVTVAVQQYHEGDGELITVWLGRVLDVSWVGGNAAELSCEPIFTDLRRVGLRRFYQRPCPHVLYGTACKVNRESYRVDGPLDSINGLDISVATAALRPIGFFSGGFVRYVTAQGHNEQRFIANHDEELLTLTSPPFGAIIGATMRLYPGCDHTAATCVGKFSNVLNYGGMPYFTKKNPFGGNPIF